MSDFDTLESSLESSRPIELYTFRVGGEVFRFTSAEDDITIDSDVYIAEAISRTGISQDVENAKRNVIITCPSDNIFAKKFINIIPGSRASATIVRLQRDEVPAFDTLILLFKGQVLDVRYPQDGHAAEIVVQGIDSALGRNLPRFSYMSQCNHVLYGTGCKVDPTLFTVTGNITDETGRKITLTGATIQPDGFYTGGYCTPVSGDIDFRVIITHVGDVLTLLLPFASPVLNTEVQAFAGCDHIIEKDCAVKFDNVPEFGGFAFVPNRNIFSDGLESPQ